MQTKSKAGSDEELCVAAFGTTSSPLHESKKKEKYVIKTHTKLL